MKEVLAFKDALDRLARLAAATEEDATMLARLAEAKPQQKHELAARMLLELRYRHEWRHAQAEEALAELAALAAAQSALVDRMREYAAALAPPPHSAADASEPWQRQLLEQQRAVANVLQLCPSNSPHTLHQLLAEWIHHSEARLSRLLAEHEWRVGAAAAANGKAPTTAAVTRCADAAEAAAIMSTESFLDRLRHQRSATCTLQAHVRGRQQRVAFAALVAQRLRSAVWLQSAARGLAARVHVRAMYLERWRAALAALSERHSARRLQRAWRWRRRLRIWAARWRADARRRGLAEDLEWRQSLRIIVNYSASGGEGPTGFSDGAIYIEATHIKEERAKRRAAAVRTQAYARGNCARREARARLAAVIRIQAGARGLRACSYHLWWRCSLAGLRAARAARCEWSALAGTFSALETLQSRAVVSQQCLHAEVEAVRRDATRERDDFEKAFASWAKQMRKATLQKKLGENWIPQMDADTGDSYFFNMKTGESSSENPNLRVARATEKKQRAAGEAALRARLETLGAYEQGLVDAFDGWLAEYAADAWELASCEGGSFGLWRRAHAFPLHALS